MTVLSVTLVTTRFPPPPRRPASTAAATPPCHVGSATGFFSIHHTPPCSLSPITDYRHHMENSRPCQNCGKRTLVPDDETGNTVCSSCGVVQEFDNFQAHIGGVTGPSGTYVGVGTHQNFRESKIFEGQKVIEDFMYKLGLSGSKSNEVKLLVEKITNADYGQGRWFPVFVGACAYVVMRKDQKVLPIVEVADFVGCDVYELGRMISRVVDFTDLKLPEFDIVYSFERAIKSCPSFVKIPQDVIQRMSQQGVFLLQCLIKWFVTTGRRPMPVVAAVLVFVGELNQVDVKIEDVAKELHVAITTCRRRYKELVERLVKVAQMLPWGKDVNVKNILKNAPSVFQYMEMKSMTKFGGKQGQSFEGFECDMDELMGDCLRNQVGYGFDSFMIEECGSQYFERDHSSRSYNPDKFQISPESLTMIYSNYLDEISSVKASAQNAIENKRKRQKRFGLQECTDWWRGQSELSKKLFLKRILEKDVGLDDNPPSFDKGQLLKEKRRERIKYAKLRIQRIMHQKTANADYSNSICLYEPEKPGKKRKMVQFDTDWEDFIIEALLLHNVKEEEIEKGHYNALLSLHVFNHSILVLHELFR